MIPKEAEAALMVVVHRVVSEAVASKNPPRGRIRYSYEYGDAAVRAAVRAHALEVLLSIRDGGSFTAYGRELLLNAAIAELEAT